MATNASPSSHKSILCYEEEGPVSHEREGLKFQQNRYFFLQLQKLKNPKMLFDGLDVYL